ncbi:MAG: DUF2188 domain-containing protein [Acidobacteriota bacterium]
MFETQDAAVKYARDAAKRVHGELYVHRRDGTIQERQSYENSLAPTRGKS